MGEPIDWKSNTSIRNVLNSIACIEIDFKMYLNLKSYKN